MTTNNNQFFAEILESNLTTWSAQTWQWNNIPTFGSIVTIETSHKKMYGVIVDITTGPTDSIRQPIPYQKTEEELLQEQPQIFEFLKTTFQIIAIGFEENNQLFFQLPQQPPKIHSFIQYTSLQDKAQIFDSSDFLYTLTTTALNNFNLEELVLAIIKQLINDNLLTKKCLDNIIETLFTLNKNNYLQTNILLHRINALTQQSALLS